MAMQAVSCVRVIFLFCVIRVSAQCLNDQRLLLLQLNVSIELQLNWDVNVDCCQWDGIGCDESGHVISLELNDRAISGDLENARGLFGLRYLERLNLANNNFANSQIPKGLGNLTSLAYLNLSNSGFGGQIPMELSEMRSLVSLDLSSLFPVDLPLKLENPGLNILVQNFTGLRELYLDHVDISSHGTSWCQTLSSFLPNLRSLSLIGCGLSGPLDPSLLKLQHHLSLLQLDWNNLSTTIPNFMANFSSLTTLSLSFCSLVGTFPDEIFQVPTLEYLDLTNNMNLGGTISLFPRNGSFRSIDLSYTNFSGSIPDSISNLSMLSRLQLSDCNFAGPIPTTLGNLTELVHLDFSNNFFTGTIPLFHMPKKLHFIDLSHNALTGALSPTHFEGLLELESINIRNNILTGTIPESLFALPALQKLILSDNKFSGQVEFSVLNSSNLVALDLSSNQLEGSFPEAFFVLGGLNALSLQYNSFTGTVHLANIQKLRNLARLELGYNYLSVDGSSNNSSPYQFPQLSTLNLASCNLLDFPDFLRNQSKLGFLDLSMNNITGEIPSWIWEIGNGSLLRLNLSFNLLVELQQPINMPRFLTVLDLHRNLLQGEVPIPPTSVVYLDYSNNKFWQPIPHNIGTNIPMAVFFSVASNRLNGTIPASICGATSLQVLDLSGNDLSGSLPPCLVKDIPSLGVLNLGGNNISGDIPDTFSVDCSLETLDFSRNDLGGKIPSSLANCRSLEIVNLGNNKIRGGFPCMLKNSPALRVLVLRNNKLQGDLSCCGTNESWPNLQIIDAAFNNFRGYIPDRCISSWRGMVLGTDAKLNSKHLRFDFLNLNNFHYEDTVTFTAKGLELKLVKILKIYTSIDLSGNSFEGAIPYTIGDLGALYALNLSHNNLSGMIPKSMGSLKELGSLDLSNNQLTGEIPEELSNLTFLSFLNLSYNKLAGMIPQGRQFLTFTSSCYVGNTGLCGFPLNVSCDSNKPAGKSAPHLKGHKFSWKLIVSCLAYGVGVALAISAFLLWTCSRKRPNKARTCINFL